MKEFFRVAFDVLVLFSLCYGAFWAMFALAGK